MYIQFQCCQCRSRYRADEIHSYTRNSTKKFYLCKHFPNVQFSYEAKWGFFTLGWRITIYDIYAKCGESKCNKWLHFDSKTFKKGTTHYNDYMECCDNVITLGAHEDDYYYSGSGFDVQSRINEKKKKQLEEIKKLLEEIKRKEREEKLRKEREEKLRKEREEKKRKEREEKLRKEREEKLRKEIEEKKRKEKEKRDRIMREQDEESEELDKFITFDTSRIQNDTKELSNKAEIIFTDNINYDVNEDIEKNFKFKISKSNKI